MPVTTISGSPPFSFARRTGARGKSGWPGKMPFTMLHTITHFERFVVCQNGDQPRDVEYREFSKESVSYSLFISLLRTTRAFSA
jgi:hypothetical protein